MPAGIIPKHRMCSGSPIPEAPNVQWITDIQPFGYRAVSGLYRALTEAVRSRSRGSYSSAISLGTKEQPQILQADSEAHVHKYADGINRRSLPAGFRRFTTPFAPDQSGAVSVLYDMGGICVICGGRMYRQYLWF